MSAKCAANGSAIASTTPNSIGWVAVPATRCVEVDDPATKTKSSRSRGSAPECGRRRPTKLALVSYSMMPMIAISDAASMKRPMSISSRSSVSMPSAMSSATPIIAIERSATIRQTRDVAREFTYVREAERNEYRSEEHEQCNPQRLRTTREPRLRIDRGQEPPRERAEPDKHRRGTQSAERSRRSAKDVHGRDHEQAEHEPRHISGDVDATALLPCVSAHGVRSRVPRRLGSSRVTRCVCGAICGAGHHRRCKRACRRSRRIAGRISCRRTALAPLLPRAVRCVGRTRRGDTTGCIAGNVSTRRLEPVALPTPPPEQRVHDVHQCRGQAEEHDAERTADLVDVAVLSDPVAGGDRERDRRLLVRRRFDGCLHVAKRFGCLIEDDRRVVDGALGGLIGHTQIENRDTALFGDCPARMHTLGGYVAVKLGRTSSRREGPSRLSASRSAEDTG